MNSLDTRSVPRTAPGPVQATPALCRRAGPDDLPALCRLGHEVTLFHHAALPDVFATPTDPTRDADLWAEAIQGEGCAAFVAERDGRLIGFVTGAMTIEEISLFHPRCFCCVGAMGVEPAERGRGVGRALMAALEAWAGTQSATEVHLSVWTFNADAIRLYDELGYAARAQLMVKPLGGSMDSTETTGRAGIDVHDHDEGASLDAGPGAR